MVNKSDQEPWGCGFSPWPCSVGYGSSISVSCGVGCRRGADPKLLRLWHRPAATAPIRPLAWELPYAAGAALENTKRQPINQSHSPTHTIYFITCLWWIYWLLLTSPSSKASRTRQMRILHRIKMKLPTPASSLFPFLKLGTKFSYNQGTLPALLPSTLP